MIPPAEIVARSKLSDWYRPDRIDPSTIPETIVQTILDGSDRRNLRDFLNPSIKSMPSPLSLKDVRIATQLFVDALFDKKRIVVVGDYDVDGVCSVVLMVRFLQEIGHANFRHFIPNRFDHGYGLTQKALPSVLDLNPDLVVTVDTGIAAKEEVECLLRRGTDVIVTDHHAPSEERLPNCAILNPKQAECDFPFKEVSGVGVAYLFLVAIRTELRNRGFWPDRRNEPNMLKHLDLVALGTVADQVPLLGLNRIFVRHGLEQMTKRVQCERASRFFFYLRAFAAYRAIRSFDSSTIGFYLGPLLNAAGRLSDASFAVRFLLSDSEAEAGKNLKELNRFNSKRKRLQQSMTKRAQTQAEREANLHSGILIYDETFHEGVIGIVAGRLSDRFRLPTIVATEGENGAVKSSCRSKHADILEILKACDAHLLQYGGHANAAGCSFRKEDLQLFRKDFYEACARLAASRAPDIVTTDIEVTPEMMNATLCEYLKILEPFGMKNRRPLFMLSGIGLRNPQVMSGKHLKWKLRHDLEMVYWDGAFQFREADKYTVACSLEENLFRGVRKIQLVVKALNGLSSP